VIALTIGGLTTMHEGNGGVDSNKAVPVRMGGLVEALEQERIDAVFSDYWIAYRLAFESRERVIATGVPTERYEPYDVFVRHSPRPAWVYIEGSAAEAHFTEALARMGVPYRTLRPGRFSVYIPARPVLPEEVRVS
jgi:hypothetical protein